MKERPILYSTPMVNAILTGNKTQTRRVMNPQPLKADINAVDKCGWDSVIPMNPYGMPGDVLWVRENLYQEGELGLRYLANNEWIDEIIIPQNYGPYGGSYSHRAIPSIHMPKWAARIWLQIESINVERLNEITEDDAIAEGVIEYEDGSYYNYFTQKGLRPQDGVECLLAKGSFQSLWCSINGLESWNLNPWVWVITFKVLSTTGKPSINATTHQINNL